MDFEVEIFRVWKTMANDLRYRKFWKKVVLSWKIMENDSHISV